MDEKNLLKADFFTSIGLVLFGAFVVVQSWNMPRFAEQGRNPYSAPGLVPGMLGALFVLFGAIMLVRSIRRGGHRLVGTSRPFQGYLADAGNRRMAIALALCLVYSLGMIGILPYALGTGLFLLAFILVFAYDFHASWRGQVRLLAMAVLEAVLVSAAVTYVFRELFLVNLP